MEIDTTAPLFPPEKSAGKLLRDLGIKKLVYGAPDGVFGLDWGYFDLIEFDRIIKNRAFTEDAADTYELRAQNEYGTFSTPRITVGTEQEFAFFSVRYCTTKECFLILVEVEEVGGAHHRYEQTVSYFRDLFNLDRKSRQDPR